MGVYHILYENEMFIEADSYEEAKGYFEETKPNAEVSMFSNIKEIPTNATITPIPENWINPLPLNDLINNSSTGSNADYLSEYINDESLLELIIHKIVVSQVYINENFDDTNYYDFQDRIKTVDAFKVLNDIKSNIVGGLYYTALTYIKGSLNKDFIKPDINERILELCKHTDVRFCTMGEFLNSIDSIIL